MSVACVEVVVVVGGGEGAGALKEMCAMGERKDTFIRRDACCNCIQLAACVPSAVVFPQGSCVNRIIPPP